MIETLIISVSIISVAGMILVITFALTALKTVKETNVAMRHGDEKLQQHLIAMNLYNKAANRRILASIADSRRQSKEANKRHQALLTELGYTSRQIFGRVDDPDEED